MSTWQVTHAGLTRLEDAGYGDGDRIARPVLHALIDDGLLYTAGTGLGASVRPVASAPPPTSRVDDLWDEWMDALDVAGVETLGATESGLDLLKAGNLCVNNRQHPEWGNGRARYLGETRAVRAVFEHRGAPFVTGSPGNVLTPMQQAAPTIDGGHESDPTVRGEAPPRPGGVGSIPHARRPELQKQSLLRWLVLAATALTMAATIRWLWEP